MTIVDRARIELAVASYDAWLEAAGATGRRRKDLRRELRANLVDAAGEVGAKEAVRRLGSTRAMAAEAMPVSVRRPRWSWGLLVAVLVASPVVILELVSALAWVDGVLAADPASPVTGSVTLLPGSWVSYAPLAGGGFEVGWHPGWLALLVAVVAFVLAARPWRAFSRGRDARTVPAGA